MKRIALLTAANLVSDAPNRRADAWLFDVEMKLLEAAFAREGMSIESVIWSDVKPDEWRAYDAAIVFCAWDYQDQSERFLAALKVIEDAGVAVYNSRAVVEWNIRKTYLRDFHDWGVPIIPTLWPEHPTADDLQNAFAAFDTDDIVLKRQIGGGARAQERYSKVTAPQSGAVLDRPGMIQPVIEAIMTEGEFSFLFIDGEFSHALIKRAKSGDYRIQEAYGGTSHTVNPSMDDMAAARRVLDVLSEKPLYARVDMVRGADGVLLLMELEVIEPYLYPEQGRHVADMLARAVARRFAATPAR